MNSDLLLCRFIPSLVAQSVSHLTVKRMRGRHPRTHGRVEAMRAFGI